VTEVLHLSLTRMYHEDKQYVDVELLAECGQIAHRLRCLEKTWFFELKELQKKSVCSYTATPKLIASLSITQKLNDLLDKSISPSIDENRNNQELVNRLNYLEDTVIKIHKQQQELLKQNHITVAATQKRVHIKGNMNYSALSGSSGSNNNNNNNDLSTSQSPTAAIHEQLISSNNGEHATGSGDNNNKKSILNNDDDEDKDQSSMAATTTTTNNKQQTQNIYQQQLCVGRITEEELQLLLRELKRKVDFTEKMNWLSEFYCCFFCIGGLMDFI
jgi:hypothetical protein